MRARSRSSSAERAPPRRGRLGFLCAAVALAAAAACEGGGETPPVVPPAPVIVSQPEDQLVFEGQSALFQVRASGTEGLTYQWRRDGTPIPGATDSHFATPRTVPSDGGSTYSVAVTNGGASSVESRAALLSINPPLDLRFQWVSAPFRPSYVHADWAIGGWINFHRGVSSPLMVGSGLCGGDVPLNCGWGIWVDPLVPGMTAVHRTGALSDLAVNWAEGLATDTIVASLDFEEANDAYAMALSQTTQAGEFTPVVQGSVGLHELQTVASSEGANGRVLTAVSFQGRLVSYVSYGWSLAPSTPYEARVISTSFDTVAADAESLAAEGYVITAFGAGNEAANGLVLVGTRVQGNTTPRPLKVVTRTSPFPDVEGYAIVGHFYDAATHEFRVIAEQ